MTVAETIAHTIWPTASIVEIKGDLVVIERYTHKRHYIMKIDDSTIYVDGLIVQRGTTDETI